MSTLPRRADTRPPMESTWRSAESSYAPRVTLTYNPIEPITIAFVQSYGGDQVEATLDAWDETRKVLDECGD